MRIPLFSRYAMYTVGEFRKLGSHFWYPYIYIMCRKIIFSQKGPINLRTPQFSEVSYKLASRYVIAVSAIPQRSQYTLRNRRRV